MFIHDGDLIRIGPNVTGRVYVLKGGEWVLTKKNKDSRGLVCWRAGTGKGLNEGVFFQVYRVFHILRSAVGGGCVFNSWLHLAGQANFLGSLNNKASKLPKAKYLNPVRYLGEGKWPLDAHKAQLLFYNFRRVYTLSYFPGER